MFLETNKLYRKYPNGEEEIYAVDGVSISLKKGEMCVVVGESGSGKSTLINMIGGLEDVSGGTIRVAGMDVSAMGRRELNDYRRDYVGFIFQFYNLIANINVRENIEICARLSKTPLSIDEIMDVVGIYDQRHKYPKHLSGGQQQRVAIARALVKNPALLLCDEPTGALDSKTSKQVLKLIEDVNKRYETTVMMITHNTKISAMADRTIGLLDGKVIKNEVNKDKISVENIELR